MSTRARGAFFAFRFVSVAIWALSRGNPFDALTSHNYRLDGEDPLHKFLTNLFPALIIFLVVWYLSKRRAPTTSLKTSLTTPSTNGWTGGPTVDFSSARPTSVKGRIKEVRRWNERGIFASKPTLGFYLDYDRSQADYGDVLVRLRSDYFARLRLQDGDELVINLKWKKGGTLAYIDAVLNTSSGQRFKREDVVSRAGVVEVVPK